MTESKFTPEYIAACHRATGGPWLFPEPREALTEIERLQSQVAEMDTSIVALDDLVERLVEAGSWLANLAIDTELRASTNWMQSCKLAENDWDECVSEWQAMKGGEK